MKRILYLLCLMIMCISSAFSQDTNVSQDYLPILEEGKTWLWEGLLLDKYSHNDINTYVTATVAGDTIVDGIPCKRLEVGIEGDDGNSEYSVFSLYEADGALYCYSDTSKKFELVLDFSKKVGDTVLIPSGNKEKEFKIFKTDIVTVNDVERRRLWVVSPEEIDYYCNYNTVQYWVEGIGSSDSYASLSKRWKMYDGCKDNQCLLNGEIIFRDTDFRPVSVGYEPLIREDRVWEYYRRLLEDNERNLFRMQFSGIKEIGGKAYNCLRITSYHNVKRGYGEWTEDGGRLDYVLSEELTEDPGKYPAFLLREESGKIYGRYDPDECPFTWVSKPYWPNIMECPDSEFVLYDFTLPYGDTYESVTHYYDCVIPSELRIIRDYDILNQGSIYRCKDIGILFYNEMMTLNYINTFVEGIGPIADGCLPFNRCRWYETMNKTKILLNNVYDLEGNVVFKGFDMDIYEGLNVSVRETQDYAPEIIYKDGAVRLSGCKGGELRIFNPEGRQLMQKTVGENAQVDITSLAPGIYLAKHSSGKTLKICK